MITADDRLIWSLNCGSLLIAKRDLHQDLDPELPRRFTGGRVYVVESMHPIADPPFVRLRCDDGTTTGMDAQQVRAYFVTPNRRSSPGRAKRASGAAPCWAATDGGMMDTELFPCPCCGSPPAYCATPDDSDDAGAYYIECTNRACQLTTPLVFAAGCDPKPHLVSKWNRRAGEWAAIDTAPKRDAHSILLRRADGLVFECYWYDDGPRNRGWFEAFAHHKIDGTHWMPKPSPPNAAHEPPL